MKKWLQFSHKYPFFPFQVFRKMYENRFCESVGFTPVQAFLVIVADVFCKINFKCFKNDTLMNHRHF